MVRGGFLMGPDAVPAFGPPYANCSVSAGIPLCGLWSRVMRMQSGGRYPPQQKGELISLNQRPVDGPSTCTNVRIAGLGSMNVVGLGGPGSDVFPKL